MEGESTHAIARTNSGTIVGTARLHNTSELVGQIRFMAVLPAFRGLGIGMKLTEFLESEARQSGLKRITLDARENVDQFYQRMGYSLCGKGDTLFGVVRHTKMEKVLY